MKIYLKNKIVSIGEGSNVLDENKNPIYKVKGKLITFTKKKLIYDMEGHLLYKVRTKFWHLLKKSGYVKDGKGNLVMKLKEKNAVTGNGFDVSSSMDDYDIESAGACTGIYRILKNGKIICTLSRQVFDLVDSFEMEYDDVNNAPLVVAITALIDIIQD